MATGIGKAVRSLFNQSGKLFIPSSLHNKTHCLGNESKKRSLSVSEELGVLCQFQKPVLRLGTELPTP